MNTPRVFRQVLLALVLSFLAVNLVQAATTVGTNISTAALTTSGIITSNSPATSTFAGGINLTNGCFALNGTCLTSNTGSYIKTDGTSVTTASIPFIEGLHTTLSSATFSVQGVSALDFNNPLVTISAGVGDPDGGISTPTSLYVNSNFNDDGGQQALQKAIYGHVDKNGSSDTSYAGYFWNEQTDVGNSSIGVYGKGESIGVYGNSANGIGVLGEGPTAIQGLSSSAGGSALYGSQGNAAGFGLFTTGGLNYVGGKTRIGGSSAGYGNSLLEVVNADGNGQLQLSYDGTNYATFNVGSTGATTIDTAGSNPYFILNDKVGVGPGTVPGTNALAVGQTTASAPVLNLFTTATNDDPTETVYQAKTTTTDATQTTLATIAIPASTTVMIEARVTARRTGGSSGTANDSAAYVVIGTFKNVSGTATLVGSVTPTYTAEDQVGWDATLTTSSGNALLRVTGAANNNISWVTTYRVYPISS